MKTLALILLLMLPAITAAQDSASYVGTLSFRHFDWTPRFLFNDLDSVVVIAAGDTVRTRGNVYLIGFEMLLLKEWDAYKAECYVDSFQVWTRDRSATYDESTGIGYDDLVYRTPYQIWMHREPTLSGFMEYIRRKVKP